MQRNIGETNMAGTPEKVEGAVGQAEEQTADPNAVLAEESDEAELEEIDEAEAEAEAEDEEDEEEDAIEEEDEEEENEESAEE
jgi:hypothetical protein